jgi:hypothetical protein
MTRYLMPLLAAAAMAAPASASLSVADQAAVYKIGRCVVKADRTAAVSLLGRLPLAGGEVEAGALPGKCAGALPAGSALALRGAIANALFNSDIEEFGMTPNRRISDLADLDLPIESTASVDPRTASLYKLGDCVVRNEMERTANFLKSEPGSRLEMTFYDRMRPTMSACQTADARTAVNRGDLRSVLAQSYYSAASRYYKGQLKHADPR